MVSMFTGFTCSIDYGDLQGVVVLGAHVLLHPEQDVAAARSDWPIAEHLDAAAIHLHGELGLPPEPLAGRAASQCRGVNRL